ncbi:PREDICTED: transmembrane emp24 domain-containing protein 4 [Thamnophis sirtalis]|uniref:Transmembrane emp24 domain-containing protein 4 n=1 Tax=Thamnophis sirtalis TaxID=35019 RepID=A0A6I9Z570_9SAUR|nr:PREDICTED: transmembrane emp24 domain-containing protein 4 [Thamnophis sirtalis]
MAGGRFVALLGALLWAGGVARGLYFHIGETEKRCFIEEIPDETMVIGNYRTQLWDKQAEEEGGREGGGKHSSRMKLLHTHTHTAPPKSAVYLLQRVHLDIQVGEHANNYPEIAAKDKLTELQLRARQLLDQVEQIQKEQNYQRFREERFRMTSESTNQRVLWWSIAQTVILLLTGIWQMRHLKSFFEAKKLV